MHVRPLVTRIVHVSASKTYTVAGGDTLSGIAGRFCGSAGKWPSLYGGNRAAIKDPDVIFPGQTFRLSCDAPAVIQTASATQQDTAPSSGKTYSCGDGDGDGYDIPCTALHQSGSDSEQSSSPQASATVTGASGVYGSVSPSSYSGFQACVISRESGGNSQVMNSSGHYGLYQFAASTWAAYGGNPADFGHASVAEQNAVFNAAMASPGGASNWSPYDGC